MAAARLPLQDRFTDASYSTYVRLSRNNVFQWLQILRQALPTIDFL